MNYIVRKKTVYCNNNNNNNYYYYYYCKLYNIIINIILIFNV